MDIPEINRPARALVEQLREMGAATVAGTLAHMGIRDPHMHGPVSWNKGKAIAGPALTLQFMPKREDLYGQNEYDDPEKQAMDVHALGLARYRRSLTIDTSLSWRTQRQAQYLRRGIMHGIDTLSPALAAGIRSLRA